jgi:hypothetical protein
MVCPAGDVHVASGGTREPLQYWLLKPGALLRFYVL